MSYLRYLCLLAHCGVQCIVCCVFILFVVVLCTPCCKFRILLLHVFTGRGKEDIKWREENIKGDEVLKVVASPRDIDNIHLVVRTCFDLSPMHSVLCFYFVCRRLMYPMLPVSLCLSSSYVPHVASFSGLSIFNWLFGTRHLFTSGRKDKFRILLLHVLTGRGKEDIKWREENIKGEEV
jgi:hypothetical protein